MRVQPLLPSTRAWRLRPGVLLLALAAAHAADAPVDDRGQVLVSFDNDIFVHKDSDYTNGVSLGWFSAQTRTWEEQPGFGWARPFTEAVPWLAVEGSRKAASIDVCQAMFTPDDLMLDPPDPNDRPYCGVLLATLGLHQLEAGDLTSVDLSLGTVGPWSGAEATQDLVHRITGSEKPQGWDDQVGNGILVNAALERRWGVATVGDPYHGFGLDGGFGATGMLGNFRTSALASVSGRIGYGMTSSSGTLSIRPGSEGRLLPHERQSPWGCHAGVILAGEAVAYDVTIDGRMFSGDDFAIDREPLLGRVALVFGGHVQRLQLYLLLSYSTKTFEQEDERAEYGRIIAVWTL